MSDKNYYSYGPFRPDRSDQQPEEKREETTTYVHSSGVESTAIVTRPQPLYRYDDEAEQRYREWTYPVKKRRSSWKSTWIAFLAGAVVVAGLMFAADATNLFSGGVPAETGSGGGNGSALKAAPSSGTTDGGVRSAAMQEVVRPGNISDIVKMASPAVVKVETYVQSSRRGSSMDPFFRQFFGDPFRQNESGGKVQAGAGSGFIFDKEGYILTNQHVIDGADEIYVQVQGYAEPFKAELLGSNFDLDLAALKITGDSDFPTLTLGNSDEIEVGDWVVAIGNPYGFDHTVTVGVLSAKERPIRIPDSKGTRNYEHLLQTDASINPGNSGGPLLNLSGEVIGINTAVSTEAQGIGFAIPTSTITSVIDNLKNDIPIPKPYVGIYMQDLTKEGLERLGLDNGVIITGVIEGSPAQESGLRAYDVIVEIDGQKVTSSTDLASRIGNKKVGDSVDLRIYRDGDMVSTRVIVGDKNKR